MTMTVKELMDKLAKYPNNMPVYTEGCDCDGDAGSVYTIDNYAGDGEAVVYISRASEKARIKMEKEKKEREREEDRIAAEQRSRGLIA